LIRAKMSKFLGMKLRTLLQSK